jgi:hypothetical protein
MQREPAGGVGHRGDGAAKIASDLLPAESLAELRDHQKSEGGLRVLGLAAAMDQPPSRGAIQSRYGVHGKVLIVVGGLATTTIDGFAFPFNFLLPIPTSSADRESRTLV